MNNLSHRKDFWGMLERHAINVSIVEDDDHLNRKSGDDPALWSESLPFASYRQCGQNPEVIDRSNHRRYHKQVLNEKIRQHRRCFNDKPLTASNGCVQWQEIHLRKQNLMDLNSDPPPTLKNKRFTSEENLMDLDRSHRRQVCESSSHCKLTKRPTANHTELSL